MKKYIPILIILVACSGSEEESNKDDHFDTTLTIVDSSAKDNLEIEPEEDINPLIKDLLENPIDLVDYKEKWGTSNGGGGGYDLDLFEVPDTIGQLYRFMLFHKLSQELPSHPGESELFHGFEITVFRYGEHIGDFYDKNEELLMIKCELDNTTLGDLNWHGKSDINIMDTYGPPQYEQDGCLIYTYQNKTITAHLTNGKVDWYKYVRLNKDIDLSESIPGILLDY